MNQDSCRIDCVTDLAKARELWEMFTTNETIYDTWQLRYCFYKYFVYELCFLVAIVENQAVALLPLQFNNEQGSFEFFGDNRAWMDGNRVYVKPGYDFCIPLLYQAINRPANLRYIMGEDQFTTQLPPDDSTYILDIQNMTHYEDYFKVCLDTELRGKFRRKIRKIESNHNIEVVKNNLDDFDRMFELNIQSFGPQSSFTFPHRKQIFRDMCNLGLPFYLLSFKVDGRIEAVSFSVLYRDSYVYLNVGINKEAVDNLNTYVTVTNLNEAMSSQGKYFDARGGNFGWKEHWRFSKIPQYKFISSGIDNLSS